MLPPNALLTETARHTPYTLPPMHCTCAVLPAAVPRGASPLQPMTPPPHDDGCPHPLLATYHDHPLLVSPDQYGRAAPVRPALGLVT